MGEMMECQSQEISSLIFLCWQRGWWKELLAMWPHIWREELHRLPAILKGRKMGKQAGTLARHRYLPHPLLEYRCIFQAK